MTRATAQKTDDVVEVLHPDAMSDIVLVCEHASRFIPPNYNDLGLAPEALESHAAWDIGAGPLAEVMADELGAPLVRSCVSRLVYDCNRPPEVADAMPRTSEVFDVPGNVGLTAEARAARVAAIYTPFHATLARTLANRPAAVLVTLHSFTPIYHGAPREVEIGVLHDSDTRLADAMLATLEAIDDYIIRRNAPYGPQDGVTHTLQKHGLAHGRPNVMIEVRNDLIATPGEQRQMGQALAAWVATAVAQMSGASTCKA